MFEQFFKSFSWFLASFLRTRRDLAIENIALRQQLAIIKDKNPRPKLKNSDRLFWVILCRFWKNWKSLINNHLHETVVIDFFSVPTISFKHIWVLIVLSHGRRKIEHFSVTMHPDKQWIKQNLRNAFPGDYKFKYLIRDNDVKLWKGIEHFLEYLGLVDTPIDKGRSWQNGYCERVIGTIKQELADKIIVLSVNQLHRLLSEYVDYYNNDRTHLGVDKDSPCGRVVEFGNGKIRSKSVAGGFYHRYYWSENAA